MKSNKCLFNKTVFKANLSQYLPFSAILGIIEIIIFPISLCSEYINTSRQLSFDDYLSGNTASCIFVFIFSAVMASLCFSYLFSPNKCNAFHAFPIGRRALFITNYISGYLLLVIPQIVGFALSLPVIFGCSFQPGFILLFQLASIFLYSFIFYSIAVFSAMLAGTRLGSVVVYGIVNFLFLAGSYLLICICNLNFFEFEFTEYLSPALLLADEKSSFYKAIVYYSDMSVYFTELVIYVIAGILLTLIAYRLYKVRRVECAGDFAAFSPENPILKVIGTVIGGMLLTYIIDLLTFSKQYVNLLIYLPCSFIAYFASQMILSKNTKVFQKKQLFGWLLCYAVSAAIMLLLIIIDKSIS